MSNGGEQTNGDDGVVFNPKSLQMSVLNMLAGVLDTIPKSYLSMLPKKSNDNSRRATKLQTAYALTATIIFWTSALTTKRLPM
nr:hypothetical protein PIFADJLK_00063 [Oryctes rhinoceros nudivirus]WDA64890.1 hypothetical protein NNONMNKP_00077 [Oryctes rhinoceros nudivirus]WDA65015.1 hypothetical protein NFEMFJFI_00065 [Oryctes rhinoceros nudivirus]WIA69683.1 hypothetical protein NALGGIOA_00062 [Oryctes rhinoceros nudivirus]